MSWRRIAGLWMYRRNGEDLIDELEFHRARLQADLESRGVPSVEALAASRRAMGNVTLAREDAREVWAVRWADQLFVDARCGVRSLARQPLIALAAVVAMALGVATTTTVFSVADAELWKPLPYPQPEQLVAVVFRAPGERSRADGISGVDLLDWRETVDAFSNIAARGRSTRQVLQLQTAQSVVVTEVTANYFVTLGRRAIAGRVFSQSDELGERQVVVTDRAWHRYFGAVPSIIGKSVRLDETQTVVLGVVNSDDSLGPDPDFFLAIDERAPIFLDRRNAASYSAIGRLRTGISLEQARLELQQIATQVVDRHNHRIEIEDLREWYAGSNWRPLYFFLGASLVVLLLSTVNVATLLMSRAISRAPEFALRRALGGGPAALTRQLLVEGVLLASAGGALGIVSASWAVAALTPLVPGDMLLRGAQIPIDLRVCVFSLATTAIATVVFGFAPLPLARSVGVSNALKSGTRAGRPARERRGRSILLIAQVALTMVLLVGAGVFLKSFTALSKVPLGFDSENLAAVRVSLSGPRYGEDASRRAYSHRLLEIGSGFPGVREATIATSAPLGSGPLAFFAKTGEPRPAPGDELDAIVRAVGPEYFRALGIRLIRGREFSLRDGPGNPRVAVINVTLAKQLFGPDQNPLGQMIDLLPGSRTPWVDRPGSLTIVGVASNVKEVGLNEVEFADVYVPFDQMPAPRLELIVRSGMAPNVEALRAAAAQIDPLMPITGASTFEQRVADVLSADAFNVVLVSSFAFVAILLAVVGIYAAAAYHVQSRIHEFGLRLALGGRPVALVSAALWRTARLALSGGILGVASVFAMAPLIGNALYLVPGAHNGLLFDVTVTDPLTLAAAFVALQVIALIAAAVPARQLTRVDPARTLN